LIALSFCFDFAFKWILFFSEAGSSSMQVAAYDRIKYAKKMRLSRPITAISNNRINCAIGFDNVMRTINYRKLGYDLRRRIPGTDYISGDYFHAI
jgi:hypothetical protein